MVPGLGLYLMELFFERYNLKAGYELDKWQKTQQKREAEGAANRPGAQEVVEVGLSLLTITYSTRNDNMLLTYYTFLTIHSREVSYSGPRTRARRPAWRRSRRTSFGRTYSNRCVCILYAPHTNYAICLCFLIYNRY